MVTWVVGHIFVTHFHVWFRVNSKVNSRFTVCSVDWTGRNRKEKEGFGRKTTQTKRKARDTAIAYYPFVAYSDGDGPGIGWLSFREDEGGSSKLWLVTSLKSPKKYVLIVVIENGIKKCKHM